MAEKTLDEEIEEAMRALDGSGPPAPPPAAETPPEPAEPPEPTLDAPAAPEEPAMMEEPAEAGVPALYDPPGPPEPEGVPSAGSRTLAALDESRRPKPEIACGICPNSVWFASPNELRCYCRVMFVQTWTTKQPGEIVSCDGMFLGQE